MFYIYRCSQCGRFAMQTPIRYGAAFKPPYFCTFPCAWAYEAARGSIRELCILMIWAKRNDLSSVAYMGRKSEVNRAMQEFEFLSRMVGRTADFLSREGLQP